MGPQLGQKKSISLNKSLGLDRKKILSWVEEDSAWTKKVSTWAEEASGLAKKKKKPEFGQKKPQIGHKSLGAV